MAADPFYFIKEMHREKDMKEKVELLSDVIGQLLVQIAKIAEYIDNKFEQMHADLWGSIHQITIQMDRVENQVSTLEKTIQTIETHAVSSQQKSTIISIPHPPPLTQAKEKVVKTSTSLRGDLMRELEIVFNRRKIAEAEE